MNVDPAVGKILGMVMAYAVSALGLLLAYYNYRTRIVKADRIFTPRALRISRVAGAGRGNSPWAHRRMPASPSVACSGVTPAIATPASATPRR